jgi:hypothetical protein
MSTGTSIIRTPDDPRRPVVAGVAGGVATSTVAVALGATDAGVFTGRPVDVLTCRATGDSLIRAARAARLITAGGRPAPVVAVTAADSSGPSRPVSARLRLLEPHTSGVIVLPYVRRWSSISTPLGEIAALTGRPREVPRPLRRYATAVRALHHAVRQLVGPAAAAPARAAQPAAHRPLPRATGRDLIR